jgi:hypothetical protein
VFVVPMVHPCSHPGCETLTMGSLCLEHEREPTLRKRLQRALPRIATATMVVAAAVAGAAVRGRFG